MEFLSAQTKYIAEQLRSLSASQRVAIALLLVVLLGGMWGMIQWGKQGDWIELLPQSLSAVEIQQVEAQLTVVGIETRVQDDRILIRGDEDERRRATAVLALSDALPKDTSAGYAALVKDDNVWESDQKARWKQNRALEAELSAVLGRFRGIRDARVLIVVPERRGLSRAPSTAKASVDVKLQGDGVLDKQRILAIANYVAGAVPGLGVKNVTLTDGSRSYRAPDASQGLAANMLDIQRGIEEHYTQKIYDQLKHIGGVVVNVSAKLRQSDEQREEINFGKPEVSSEESKTQEMRGADLAREPAVRPNVGRGLAGGGSGSTSNSEESRTEFNAMRDQKTTRSSEPRGTLEQVTASVNVPSSYLLRVLKAQRPEVTETTRKDIQEIADVELLKIEEQVKPLVVIESKDDEGSKLVVVDWYYDLPDEGTVAAEVASIDVLGMAKGYGPHVGLGLLAVLGMYMMFRIAKKAQLTIAAGGRGSMGAGVRLGRDGGGTEPVLHSLGGGREPVGEVGEMEGVLMGHEVDEGTVRTQQIVSQIGEMVDEDPAAVAGVVESWLSGDN
ncbi:MAG: hypothetical protein JXQ75_21590 [Phycisphaerae bacterium]|nr:hypothetical protein [Phycisphaerae bacterium]